MVVLKIADVLKVCAWSVIFVLTWNVSSPANEPEKTIAPLPKPQLHHVLIEVNDIKKSLAFYRDCLGLVLTSQTGDFATLESTNSGIYLWQKSWDWEKARAKDGPKGIGMYPHFNVTDIFAAIDRFKKAGYVIIQKPISYDWGSEAFVQDPDGYIIALVTMAKTK